jgi:predicted RNA-binding protein YlqC (UPF0109 family)
MAINMKDIGRMIRKMGKEFITIRTVISTMEIGREIRKMEKVVFRVRE